MFEWKEKLYRVIGGFISITLELGVRWWLLLSFSYKSEHRLTRRKQCAGKLQTSGLRYLEEFKQTLERQKLKDPPQASLAGLSPDSKPVVLSHLFIANESN